MSKSMIVGGLVGAAVVAAGAVGALALNKNDSVTYAEVVLVDPVIETVRTPREACHNELVTHQNPTTDEHKVAGTVIGAVIGGVAGNQVGGGSGKKLATVAGAAAGGYAGNQIQGSMQENSTHQVNETRCETQYDDSQRTIGYDVTYTFEEQKRTVRMEEKPGDWLEVDATGNLVVEQKQESGA